MARVIAVANQKGGVGKTTTTVNLAASLAVAEQRTLIVDGDPQGNATSGVGAKSGDDLPTLYDVLIGPTPIESAVQAKVHFDLLDVVPATPDLAGAEVELIDRENRGSTMRDALEPLRNRYDFHTDRLSGLARSDYPQHAWGSGFSPQFPLQCE